MPESETLVVFRILKALAKSADVDHALPVEGISVAAHLGRADAMRYINILEHAGAVRATPSATQSARYCLTNYGHERLAGVS